jgi:hypothetical protein
MNLVALSAVEETHLGIFVITFFWALFSGACVVANAHVREHQASGVWAPSLLTCSLVAAYCFGRLL